MKICGFRQGFSIIILVLFVFGSLCMAQEMPALKTDVANVYDSLAEAYMNDGDIDLAIKYYKKTLEIIPKDRKADKAYLERIKQGATENLKKLEAKKKKE